MATAARPAPSGQNNFRGWLESEFVRVAARRQHGQWYAVAEDFGVVAVAPTEADSHREVLARTELYLRSYWQDGFTYRDAWRPVSPATRYRHIFWGFVARATQRLPINVSFAEESRALLPLTFTDTNS